MKTYKDRVESLLPHQYFVFGSNTEGRHGKGAALVARIKFGAIYGQPKGFQGQCYAIVTKNLKSNYHPSISKKDIMDQILVLYDIAMSNQDKEFLVAYQCGTMLNGYLDYEMASMFAVDTPPSNVVFEKQFSKLVKKYL